MAAAHHRQSKEMQAVAGGIPGNQSVVVLQSAVDEVGQDHQPFGRDPAVSVDAEDHQRKIA